MHTIKGRQTRDAIELLVILSVCGLIVVGGLIWNGSLAGDRGSGTDSSNAPLRSGAMPGATTTPPAPTPTAMEPREGLVPPLEGVPAIEPSLNNTPADVPAITEADVQAYITQAFPGATIASVEFVSGDEVETRYGVPPGRLAGRLMAVVTLDGEFSVRLPPEVPPIVASRKILVFDAHTGNELMNTYPRD